MESKQTRLSAYTLNRIRVIGKEIGSPTDDTILRHIVEGYESMKHEIENLKRENKEIKRANIDIKARFGIEQL